MLVCVRVQGTILPRATEPRQSDADMTANTLRQKDTERGGAAAASGSGAAKGSNNQTITELVIRDHNLVKKLYQGTSNERKRGERIWR